MGMTASKEVCMLAEFSIIPIGVGSSVGDQLAEVLKIVDASGLPYKVNPMGTVVEGRMGRDHGTDKKMPFVGNEIRREGADNYRYRRPEGKTQQARRKSEVNRAQARNIPEEITSDTDSRLTKTPHKLLFVFTGL